MKIGIPREIFEDERRVAATPPSVHKLIGLGYEVMVEAGAGEAGAGEHHTIVTAYEVALTGPWETA